MGHGTTLSLVTLPKFHVIAVPDMGGCQNYGPFLGTLNIRCRIIIGSQKGTIILITTYIDNNNSSNNNGNYSHNSMNSNGRMHSNNHGV